MYKRVETAASVMLNNGEQAEPVATLADEHGGVSHWIRDDGCYVLVNMFQLKGQPVGEMVSWIYPEALEVLKELPPLR